MIFEVFSAVRLHIFFSDLLQVVAYVFTTRSRRLFKVNISAYKPLWIMFQAPIGRLSHVIRSNIASLVES